MRNFRMNKNNKVILGLLAILLTMSVGYAIFSDSVKVSGTAIAKSDWGFTVTCNKGMDSSIKSALPSDEYPYLTENGYSNDTCTVSGNSVTINTALNYPTARRYFTLKIKNTGGVDMVIKADEPYYPNPYKLQLYNKSTNELYKEYVKGVDSTFSDVIDNYSEIGVEVAALEDENGNIIVSNLNEDVFQQRNMIYEDSEGTYYLKIAPNQTLNIVVIALWDEEAVSTNYYSKSIGTFNFDLTQFTTDLKLSPNGYTCFAGC